MKYKIVEVQAEGQTSTGNPFLKVVLEDTNQQKYSVYIFGKKVAVGDELEGELKEVKKNNKTWLKFLEKRKDNNILDLLNKILQELEVIKSKLLE